MRFRASETPRLVKCPASHQIQKSYPYSGEDRGAEGRVADKIVQDVLVGGKALDSFLGQSIDNTYIDQEFLTHLEVYIDDCEEGGFIEDQMEAESQGMSLVARPDYWRYNAPARRLEVKDLKFGHGWVEVYQNWQLLTGAILICDNKGIEEMGCKTIELSIIQPRANHPEGPVRRWSFDFDLLRGYRNGLLGAMAEASLDDPPVHTGPHCRYCTGVLHCHGAQAAAGYALDYSAKASHSAITPDALSLELELVERAVNMLSQRKTALEEEAFNMNRSGKIIPGWEVSTGFTPLAWTVDPIAVGDAMKIDLRAPAKPITPTQAISRKMLPKETVEALAARGTSGPKLKRVDSAKAKRILGGA